MIIELNTFPSYPLPASFPVTALPQHVSAVKVLSQLLLKHEISNFRDVHYEKDIRSTK